MKEWFEEWFSSEEYLDVYKHRNNQDADLLLNLILKNINLKRKSKILDAACGAGRHSIKLAEKGFSVTAFDLSQTLLNVGIKEADEKNLKINFIQSDIRDTMFDTKFDLIINLFTSFGYFENDDENFKFINNSFHYLNDNSYFVFDYFNKAFIENNLVPSSEKIIDGKRISEKRYIKNGRVVKEIEIEKTNLKNSFHESVKLYDPEIIIEQFNRAGYLLQNKFGNYSGGEFDINSSERLILFFRK